MFMTRSSSIASANWGHICEGGRAGWPAPTRRSATPPRTARRPDVSVDCAPPRADSYEAHRPTVVIAVLSPSTRKIDRVTKLEEYRRHPSLRHILLIDPDAAAAKLYSRPHQGPGPPRD